MKTHVLAFALLTTFVASNAFAQHSDIEFGYDDLLNPTELEIEVGEEDGTPLVTATGIPFFEADFEEFDPTFDPGNFSAEDPGFATASAEELNANTGDQIFVEVLDASSGTLFGGLGYSTFYNPVTDSLEAGGNFLITGSSDAFAPLQIEDASVVGGSTLQFIDTVENNVDPITGEIIDFDQHIIFDVLDDSTLGAYAFLLQLHSNFAGTTVDDGFELSSEPFFVFLNRGLGEEFEGAVAAFETAAVPEPGTVCLLTLGVSSLLLRRRRR